MSDKVQKQEAVEKVLGEPIGFSITETASKVRKGLLLASFVVLVLVLGEVSASDKVSIFGIELAGITSEKLLLGLCAILSYSLVHYIWVVTETFGEWVLRITGTRLSFITAGMLGGPEADYPTDPKQSTLYKWWIENTQRTDSSAVSLKGIQDSVELLMMSTSGNNSEFSAQLEKLQKQLITLDNNILIMNKALDSPRIEVSLQRFDRWFELVLRSQNLRVLLVDILIPIALGVYALLLVVNALKWI